MKICMLIPRFLPVIGGTERQCWILSRELAKRGNRVFILTQREKGTPYFERKENVEIFRLPGLSLPGFPSFGLFFSATLFLVLFAAKYEILYVHLATSLAIGGLLASKFLGKKSAVKFAGAGFTGDVGTSKKKIWGGFKLKLIKDNFDFFVAPSKEVARELAEEKFPWNKIKLISNGVDTNYFIPLPAEKKEELKKQFGVGRKKVFLFVGRIAPPKDVGFLLDAWKNVSPERKVLFIVGEGPDKKRMEEKIKSEGIKDVVMAGATDDVRQYYQMADFFILPTRAEGMSNSLLEAMSCAAIPLASDIPANRETVENGKNGFLFSMENEREFIGLLEKAMDGLLPEKEAGRQARETVVRNFSILRVAVLFERGVIFPLTAKRF